MNKVEGFLVFTVFFCIFLAVLDVLLHWLGVLR